MEKQQTDISPIKTLISKNIGYFECILLLKIMKDFSFWKSNCYKRLNTKVGSTRDKNLKFNDFNNKIDNDIYNLISEIYSSFISFEKVNISASADTLKSMLKIRMDEGKIYKEEYESMVSRIDSISDIDINDKAGEITNDYLITNGFFEWLNIKRTKQTLAFNLSEGVNNADDVIQSIKDNTTIAISNTVEMEDVKKSIFESDITGEGSIAERMGMSNLPVLTTALGGGPMRGECGLGISMSSGGKTILATQMSAGFALSGYNVVYITTEQRSYMLIPRMVASSLSIKFDKIKNGIKSAFNVYKMFGGKSNDELPDEFKGKVLTKSEYESIIEFIDKVNPHLRFENWCDKGLLITQDLETTVKAYKEKNNIDVLVLDWIGGGIQMDPKDHRPDIYYRNVADLIKTISAEYNIFTYALAQAADSASDKSFISATDIDQCKKLDVPFTFAMGITTMFSEEFRLEQNQKRRKKDGLNNAVKERVETYNRLQNMCIWKNRMDPASVYPIERDFAYQRFNERVKSSYVTDIPTQKLDTNDFVKQQLSKI